MPYDVLARGLVNGVEAWGSLREEKAIAPVANATTLIQLFDWIESQGGEIIAVGNLGGDTREEIVVRFPQRIQSALLQDDAQWKK